MIKKVIKNQKGLTLIELLAVVVILGIIAAIAVPAIGNVIEKTKLDAVKADAMQVLDAAKLAVASEGVPDDGDFQFRKADSTVTPAITGLDELGKFVQGVDLESYTVKVTGSQYVITFKSAPVNGKVYSADEVNNEDLQKKDFFTDTKVTTTDAP